MSYTNANSAFLGKQVANDTPVLSIDEAKRSPDQKISLSCKSEPYSSGLVHQSNAQIKSSHEVFILYMAAEGSQNISLLQLCIIQWFIN